MASTPAWRAGATSTRRFATGAANTPATRMATASARCTSTPSRGSGPCCAPGFARTGASRRTSCRSISASSNSCTTHAAGAKPCLAHSSPPWSYDPAQHPGRQQEPAVIGLEPQQVIGAPVEDLARDRLLAAHGIQRHDAVFQGQRLEQRRDRGNLVRLAVNLTLAERQALLTGPGADQVQWRLCPAAVKGAAQRLAVDRHDLAIEGLGKGLRPGAEAGLEGVRVYQHEDPRKVSCEGMPLARVRKDCNQFSLVRP